MRRLATALLICTLLFATARAQEPSGDVPAAADAVVTAQDDGEALRKLAEQDSPDPWIVVDALLARGQRNAALAFARASDRPDVAALAKYVETFDETEAVTALRTRVQTAESAMTARDAATVLAEIGEPPRLDAPTVVQLRAAFVRASALQATRELRAAYDEFQKCAAAAEALGWLRLASRAYRAAGHAAMSAQSVPAAIGPWERRLAVCERRKHPGDLASSLTLLGSLYRRARRLAEARDLLQRAVPLSKEVGNLDDWVSAQLELAHISNALGSDEDPIALYEKARAAALEAGSKRWAANALLGLGSALLNRGEIDRAVQCHVDAIAELEASGNQSGLAAALVNFGNALARIGDDVRALEFLERGIEACRTVRRADWEKNALIGIAQIERRRGRLEEALTALERGLELSEATGVPAETIDALIELGQLHAAFGRFGEADDYLTRGLDTADAAKDPRRMAYARNCMAALRKKQGRHADALRLLDQARASAAARGDVRNQASSVGAMGATLVEVGEIDRGIELLEQARKMLESIGDQRAVTWVLSELAGAFQDSGRFDEALGIYERVLAQSTAVGDARGASTTRANIAIVHYQTGDYEAARKLFAEAVAAGEATGDQDAVALNLGNLGNALLNLDDLDGALDAMSRSVALKEESGHIADAAVGWAALVDLRMRRDEPTEALAAAKRSVELLNVSASGLGADEGTLAREKLASMYRAATVAALHTDDLEMASFFLESGRAGALIEGLQARELLWSEVLSPELREAESSARAAETRAAQQLRKALAARKLRAVRDARASHAAAVERVAEVTARIQREAKAGADLVRPRAASTAEIRAALEDGDVLVLYADLGDRVAAFVMDTKTVRAVPLASMDELGDAVARLRFDDPSWSPDADVAALAKLVVEPLGLSGSTKRVLVSPTGVLSKVPFATMFPSQPVAYVPSGTALTLLADERDERGDGVLALGDPDYDAKPSAEVVAVNRGPGMRLTRLPGTRAEVEAIGTEVLLGARANESELRTSLGKQERWRAIHFACHGLIDMDRPGRSSLALTATATDDGFLTALDVFRLRMPADMAVLSACDTGTGKVVNTEGIVGLTRAFMFAGTPRVLCSLWKVDDEATSALMIRFYELWNPKTGDGLPAAEALRRAQEHIRAQERWSHPNYWAAWTLWGLPD